MSIREPYQSVSKKGKHVPRKKDVNASSLPEYTQQDITEHDITRFIDHSESNEVQYLKRLKLRAQVLSGPNKNLVPPISGLEAEIGIQLSKLNTIALDRSQRLKLDFVCLKFKTDSLYEIAKALAVAKMERQTIKEVQTLVDADDIGVALEANYNAISDSTNVAEAARYTERIRRRDNQPRT